MASFAAETYVLYDGNFADTVCLIYCTSGDKSLPKNYRPISVTPILCRLLETIVREVIVQHIKTNDIIINQQYGFREKRGCVLQLLTVLDKLVTSLENGNPVDMIYLDTQKAFDSVPHKRLIKKIKMLGNWWKHS